RAVLAAVGLLIATGFFRLWWAYRAVSYRMEQLDTRLEERAARSDPAGLVEVLRDLAEYDLQMARKPPVPDWFVDLHRAEPDRIRVLREAEEHVRREQSEPLDLGDQVHQAEGADLGPMHGEVGAARQYRPVADLATRIRPGEAMASVDDHQVDPPGHHARSLV